MILLENPTGPHIVVGAINEMDGSMILGLMNYLAQDLEWDQFLFTQARNHGV